MRDSSLDKAALFRALVKYNTWKRTFVYEYNPNKYEEHYYDGFETPNNLTKVEKKMLDAFLYQKFNVQLLYSIIRDFTEDLEYYEEDQNKT